MDLAQLLVVSATIIGISLSGVLSPGPMLAITISESTKRGFIAGPLVAVGHLVVEAPTILALWFGLGVFLGIPELQIAIGLTGGAILLFLGQRSFREGIKKKLNLPKATASSKKYSAFIGGIITSALNPFFIAWWISIGALFLPMVLPLGLFAPIFLIAVHWPLDLGWYSLVSYFIGKGGTKFLAEKTYRAILAITGIILLFFGSYFIVHAVQIAFVRPNP